MQVSTVTIKDVARYGTFSVREVQALQKEEKRLKRQLTPAEIKEKLSVWKAYTDEKTGEWLV